MCNRDLYYVCPVKLVFFFTLEHSLSAKNVQSCSVTCRLSACILKHSAFQDDKNTSVVNSIYYLL